MGEPSVVLFLVSVFFSKRKFGHISPSLEVFIVPMTLPRASLGSCAPCSLLSNLYYFQILGHITLSSPEFLCGCSSPAMERSHRTLFACLSPCKTLLILQTSAGESSPPRILLWPLPKRPDQAI